ncbi:DnaJ family domain-containing protein [Bacillus horti]|uniref:DnaJ homologue subfamily C member 28 conserved domain-containing protein n=1 Tax=Caldalkalibacillus horti TaxID=77523 RepID=A0ABT9W2P3_9BACI|nr:DnaJ family domain-containing protein [Bacillus horti]MDQ0167508.1 hypothetical protein [Bacillus horti]
MSNNNHNFDLKNQNNQQKARVNEDQAQPKYQSWMDTIYNDYVASGGMDDLPGKGNPLNLQNKDALQSVLEEAGYIPQWLELQHKIRDQLLDLIKRKDSLDEQSLQAEVIKLNQQIAKFNSEVPNAQLQKTRIFPDIMEKQVKHWL